MSLNLEQWQQWRPLLVGVAARKLGNRRQADAEDVVQDATIQMMNVETDRPIDRAYMLTSVKNMAINRIRHYNTKSKGENHEDNDAQDYLEDAYIEEDKEAGLAAQETRERVDALLSQLSPNQRIAVESFHLKGKSYRQIGQENGWTDAKVKREMFLGLDKMRHILGCSEPHERGKSPPDNKPRGATVHEKR